MSDDSDLLIAAAATAAVVTWMGTRSRKGRDGKAVRRDWPALLRSVWAGFVRSWRETGGYQFIKGIRDAFFRDRDKR